MRALLRRMLGLHVESSDDVVTLGEVSRLRRAGAL